MLKSIAVTLVAPLKLCFVLLLIAAVFALLRKPKVARILAILSAVWLLLWSQPYFSNLLLYPLEYGWSYAPPSHQPELILVPGCYYNTEGKAAEISRWNTCALERYAEAVRQYHQHQIPVLVTGGHFLHDPTVNYSARAKALLISMGIPASKVLTTGAGSTTAEGIRSALPFITGKTIMVISSATHFRRIRDYLHHYKIDFTYTAVDYKSDGELVPYLSFPTSYALGHAHSAFYEYGAIIKRMWSA